MKKNLLISGLTFLFVFAFNSSFSQAYTLEFNVVGQPQNPVVLGAIKGDNFAAVDSILPTGEKIQFKLPQEAHPGVYRIILGQTTYARVMDGAPQQIDFIFNKENIAINTHFKHPTDSLKIVRSKENSLWYAFLDYEENYKNQFRILEDELDLLWSKGDTAQALEKTNEFNRLQMARDLYIGQQAQQNSELLAAKMMDQFREPILDGFLTPKERKEVFQKYYFKTVDFTDERLINSAVYTDKVFVYLVSYNKLTYTKSQRESEYMKAVDIILKNTKENERVHQFIIDYLVHGFKVLKLDKVIAYINENYY